MSLPLLRFPNKYYAFLAHFGLPDMAESRKRIAAYLENLAELRFVSCDWALSTAELARHAKVATTSEPLPKAAEAGRIRPDALPRLETSDAWQVAMGATRDFLTMTRQPVSYINRREK